MPSGTGVSSLENTTKTEDDRPLKKKSSPEGNNDHSPYCYGRWSQEEHRKFINGIIKYQTDWKRVQGFIKTRTTTQTRSHAQKFFIRAKNIYEEIFGKEDCKENFTTEYVIRWVSSQVKKNSEKENIPPKRRKKIKQFVDSLLDIGCYFDNNSQTKEVNDISFESDDVQTNEETTIEIRIVETPGEIFEVKKDKSRRESINKRKQEDHIPIPKIKEVSIKLFKPDDVASSEKNQALSSPQLSDYSEEEANVLKRKRKNSLILSALKDTDENGPPTDEESQCEDLFCALTNISQNIFYEGYAPGKRNDPFQINFNVEHQSTSISPLYEEEERDSLYEFSKNNLDYN